MDVLEDPLGEDFDYVLICGMFNNAIPGATEFLKSMALAAFQRARKGLGLSFISNRVNFVDDCMAYHALDKNFGTLLVARCSTGEAASAYLCLFDRRCAYFLFGANHPELRKTAASTYLMFHEIDLFRGEGMQYFDFVRINSPNRGDFKVSFNAQPKPYYAVSWARQNSAADPRLS
jgi:Acetyltransferase (GNAT) domain